MATISLELARAKLTRTLRVTGRRSDGYHLLSSEMVAVDLADELFIEEEGAGLVVEA
jgi:4-diphosphocytidyl-2C-methyl-D-erythritol kinase